MTNAPLFFISYARKEKTFMDAVIKTTLYDCGITFWYDDHIDSTIEDDKWWTEICNQIELAPYFIFLFTDKWQKSKICKKEFDCAESMGKKILPVMINEFNIHNENLYIEKSLNTYYFYKKDGQDRLQKRLINAKQKFEKRKVTFKDKHPKSQLLEFCSNISKNNENIRILGKGKPRKLLDVYQEIFLKPINQGASSNVTARDILFDRYSNHILLIGSPGSGKSTLLQYFQIVATEGSCTYFPVKISFRALLNRDKNFLDWLKEHVHGQTGVNLDVFCDLNNKQSPNLMILLDGLDEISDTDYQRISKEIINFIDSSPNIKFIITTRPTGYHKEDFLDFDSYELLPLKEKNIRDYIEKTIPKKEVEKIWNIITSHSRIYELAETPFLLAMIASAYSELGSRAEQRATLYRKCIAYLLRVENWEPKRKKTPDNEGESLLKVLKTIALKFYKLESNGSFSKAELLQIISLIPGYQNEADKTLKIIEQRTGLLQIDSEGYHFIHRSIWEYLAAEGCREENLEQIAERAYLRLWEEPIRLYVGLTPTAELFKTLEMLWKRNTTLTLRCMTETLTFHDEILKKLYENTNFSDKKRIVYELVSAANRSHNEKEKERILIDTVSVLAKIEKNCEIIYELITILKGLNTSRSIDLISNILQSLSLIHRFEKYINDKSYMLDFILIKNQKYHMGINKLYNGKTADASEKPSHLVSIDSFYVSKYLVTNKLYYDLFPFSENRKNEYSNKNCQPVNMISWYEACIFAWWLGCDLLTDSEWELMARAGGKDDEVLTNPNLLPKYAWYGENSDNKTHNVGTKNSNSFGIYDVAGNLREWVNDWYSESYYTECSNQSITKNPKGPMTGDKKVLRGGTFDWALTNLRPTYRNCNTPDNKSNVSGFRLVYRYNNEKLNKIFNNKEN